MPNGIVPDEGLADQLDDILSNDATLFAPWALILWTNDYVPTAATVVADLTEATFTGYSRRSLLAAGWSSPTIAGHAALSTHGTGPQVYTNGDGGPVTVFGTAYLDVIAGKLRKVQRFDPADIVAVDPGGTIAVTPEFSYRSQLATE